ncbi:hypothetical protein M569_08076, partial [Genlisea aurea]
PVLVQTDHRALEHWVTENVDTPSGPRGRRGRWHEILSQFDVTIEYLPGNENVVADAMSRWAYPATSARQDVSWHGGAEAKHFASEQVAQDFLESRGVMFLRVSPTKKDFVCQVMAQGVPSEAPAIVEGEPVMVAPVGEGEGGGGGSQNFVSWRI